METQLLDDDVEQPQQHRQPHERPHGQQQDIEPVAQLRVVSIASIAQARVEPAQVFVDQVWKLYAGKTALGRDPPSATHDALHRITMTNDRLQHAYQAEINIEDRICHIRNEGASYHLTRSRPNSNSSTTSTLINPGMWYELSHGDHILFGKRITAAFEWIQAPQSVICRSSPQAASTLLLDNEEPDLNQAATLRYDIDGPSVVPNAPETQLFSDSTEPRRHLGETQMYTDHVEEAVPSTLPYHDNPLDVGHAMEATQVYQTDPEPAHDLPPAINADQATLAYGDDILNASHDSGDADSAPAINQHTAKATQLFEDDDSQGDGEAVELPPSPVVGETQLFDDAPPNGAISDAARPSAQSPNPVQESQSSKAEQLCPKFPTAPVALVVPATELRSAPQVSSRTPRRSSRKSTDVAVTVDKEDEDPQLEVRSVRSSRKRKSLAETTPIPETSVTPSSSPAKRRKTTEDSMSVQSTLIAAVSSSKDSRSVTNVALSPIKRGRVLLTSIPAEKKATYARYVKALGWHLIEHDDQNAISPATHIVISKTLTGPTLKLLQAISVCINLKFVITQEWLECSERHGAFVDETPFLLPPSSPICKTYGFSGDLSTLSDGPRNKLFLGYTFYISPSNASPTKDEICRVVEAAGGACTNHMPSSYIETTVIIGCADDWDLLSKPRTLSYKLYTFDLIKFAIMRQRLEWKKHTLSNKNSKKK